MKLVVWLIRFPSSILFHKETPSPFLVCRHLSKSGPRCLKWLLMYQPLCITVFPKQKKRCGWNWKAIHFYNNIEFSFAWYIERYSSALISRRTVFSSVGYLQYHHVARRGQTWLKCECARVLWIYIIQGSIFIEQNQCISCSVSWSKSSSERSVGHTRTEPTDHWLWFCVLEFFDHLWSTLIARACG